MNKGGGRCFGQDLMRGEHTVGGGVMPIDKGAQRLAPGGGGAWLGGRATASTSKFLQSGGAEGDSALGLDEGPALQSGTSIFDPVLCELAYRWFCPPGGMILDPFAGGSVRGVVAGVLGYRYAGFELRAGQVAANEPQAAAICPGADVRWYCGDSAETVPKWQGRADFLFSCPPYGNLEVYSEAEADLSAMPDAAFDAAYSAIIAAACEKLGPDAFAGFVVGNYRDKRGFYRDLVGLTVRAFEAAGLHYYNECILVTAVGSLPIRVGQQFRAARKLGKTHQNFLVFCKGNPKKAVARWAAQVGQG
jgi:hypothetical protein